MSGSSSVQGVPKRRLAIGTCAQDRKGHRGGHGDAAPRLGTGHSRAGDGRGRRPAQDDSADQGCDCAENAGRAAGGCRLRQSDRPRHGRLRLRQSGRVDRRCARFSKRSTDCSTGFANGAPRNAEGILYHVFNAPEMWSDGFNCAPPFLAAMGFYDEALTQIEGYRKRLWNPDKKLLAHIWDDQQEAVQGRQLLGRRQRMGRGGSGPRLAQLAERAPAGTRASGRLCARDCRWLSSLPASRRALSQRGRPARDLRRNQPCTDAGLHYL